MPRVQCSLLLSLFALLIGGCDTTIRVLGTKDSQAKVDSRDLGRGEWRPEAGASGCDPSLVGKACTERGGECGADESAARCLLTSGSRGVCVCSCLRDDPKTAVNEDSCPDPQRLVCGAVPLSANTTEDVCLARCEPRLGSSSCSAPLACRPESGAKVGLFGQAVCIAPGCERDEDCPVSSSVACRTDGTEPCAAGQRCVPSRVDGVEGTCAKAGRCDVASGLCAPRSAGFDALAAVGDPCTDDSQCAAQMRCEREEDLARTRRSAGALCSSGEECCSGRCVAGTCAAGLCPTHARGGYCVVEGCAFAASLGAFACPAGSACNLAYPGGLCQRVCSLADAGSCRGRAADRRGDYECRAWQRIQLGGRALAPAPLCDFGDAVRCTSFQELGCEAFGAVGNPTQMACRDLAGDVLPSAADARGLCLDSTSAGP